MKNIKKLKPYQNCWTVTKIKMHEYIQTGSKKLLFNIFFIEFIIIITFTFNGLLTGAINFGTHNNAYKNQVQ